MAPVEVPNVWISDVFKPLSLTKPQAHLSALQVLDTGGLGHRLMLPAWSAPCTWLWVPSIQGSRGARGLPCSKAAGGTRDNSEFPLTLGFLVGPGVLGSGS